MSKFLQRIFVCTALMALPFLAYADDFQVSNANFEDWSGTQFDGQPQAKGWNASNVEQVGIKFNFAHKETGHNGGYCMMVQDQDVGAMGISATSPGYFALGKPWAYLPSITAINQATAGTSGGITWTHRPDSMAVWIKRTGSDWTKEDFYLLYYSWSGTAKGTSYKNKQKSCTDHTETNEESDIRQAMNGNECGTAQKATQVAEGMWRERAQYSNWTKITLPIYYFNNTAPQMMNIIFSASNYPNFRANDGLYAGNSLYVDDVQLIYASTIQKLYVGGREWKDFDPNSKDVQIYELAEDATSIPSIEAYRGAGSLTNARGTTVTFAGRKLEGSEISITNGDVTSTPTTITVRAEDGKSTTTYKIQFQKAAGSNAKLASISVDGFAMSGFNPAKYNYTYDLPYGTTQVPVVTVQKQEDEQTVEIKQATSVNGTATITVTAANGTTKATYSITFKVAQLADNTLQDILVNGKSVPGFTPSQTVYKVSLPVGTTQMPTVKAVSAYPDGEQTIVYTAPETIDGGQYQISVTTPGNSVAKVYKLNFKLEASSYKYLKDLQVTGSQIDHVNPAQQSDQTKLLFTPENLSYNIYLKIGSTTLPNIVAVKGDEYQAEPVISSLPAGVVDGTIRITTQAGNGDQAVYKLNFSTSKSSNSYLSNILVGGQPLPNFRPDSFDYEFQLPVGTTTVPEVKGIAGDEYQTVDDPVYGGLNGTTRISVTAGDGSTTTYSIKFSVDTYTDNTLKSLKVEGYSLQNKDYNPVEFDPQVNEYWVKLSPETTTTLPTVTAVLQNEQYQDSVERRPNGLNGDYKITVRPRNGASRTYVIHFVYKQSDNTALRMIYLNGDSLEGFDPDKTDYTQVLDTGTTELPVVTADLSETSQDTTIVWDGKTVRITVKAQSGARRTYKIKFVIPSASSAQLEMIYVNGDSLEGFDPKKDEYDYTFSTPTCPAVTVKAAEGQQVTITTPYAAGDAKITVKTEDGTESKYTIHFFAEAPATVRLEDIKIDGHSLKDEGIFEPATMHYERTYTGERPEIGYEAGETVADVQILWKDETALLFVSDKDGNHATYEIAFTRIPSTENTLEAIYADFGAGAQVLGDFDPAKTDYHYTLVAGSELPEVTYKAKDNSQVVFFGQTSKGEWKIIVEAEDGAQKEYTVTYTIDAYDDATLENLLLDGTQIAGFASGTYEYELELDNGAELPKVTVETKQGQRILIQTLDVDHQQVRVDAESGAFAIYNITYKRKISSNAFLKDILVNGISQEGFAPDNFTYIDSLDRLDEDLNPVTVVPNVYPIGQLPNQTITTYYSRINGTTRINVMAEDGATENDYFIEFPVRKSNNNMLEDIELLTEDDLKFTFKPKTLEYTVELPYGTTTCPQLDITKGESEQRVDIISRPIGETTEVVVYAENGDSRTYKILFKMEPMKVKNLLTMIRIKELDQELSLKDKEKRIFDVEIPFGSRSMTVEYAKTYDEQTVFVQPGGVHDTTFILVKSNNDTIQDELYKINPILQIEDPATLTDIKVNGTTIPGFDPEKFSYIVPFVVELDTVYDPEDPSTILEIKRTKPNLKYTLKKGAEIDIVNQTSKHWQAEVTYGEGSKARTNTYHVWYYYQNEQVPSAEFTTSEWTPCETYSSNGAQKPIGWHTIADALGAHGTFTPEDLVQKETSPDAVHLHSAYSVRGGGTIPGFITLGKVSGSWGVAGSSAFAISGGIAFHNSPDVMKINYKQTKFVSGKTNQIQYILTGMDDAVEKEWTESSTSSSYSVHTYDLSEINEKAGEPISLNIILNSFNQTSSATDPHVLYGNPQSADLYVDWIRFEYNHTLTGLKVDAFNATKSGNAFSVDLTDPERIELPVLKFTGEVEDQAQEVAWNIPTKDADFEIRTANIINWAENGSDFTEYTLTVKRPLDIKNQLATLLIGGDTLEEFAPDKIAYEINLESSSSKIKDVQPVPASSLQTVTTSFDEATSTFTITVKPEKESEETTTYTIHFNKPVSSDATLEKIVVDGHDEIAYDAATTEYTVKDDYLPVISFTKKYDKQLVSIENGVITVTAEDGTTKTYTFLREDPDYTPNGTISKFTIGTEDVEGFGDANHTKIEAKPEGAVFFTRKAERDLVEFIQTETYMEWRIPGAASDSYVWSFNTGTPSANADLAGIALNGENYDEYIASKTAYELTSDTTIVVDAILAENTQALSTSISLAGDTIEYSMTVTAEDGTKKTYKLNISRPKSDDNTLAGIYLDDVLLPDFDPNQELYTVILPTPAIKTAQPQMPSITYMAGHEGQSIILEPGEVDGDPTKIQVTSEAGLAAMKEYSVEIQAEKSHCVDLSGITVNGVAIQGDKDEHFEPGRHYYSLSLKTSDIEIGYTSDDKFQKVDISSTTLEEESQYRYILHVTAEDGVTTADYQINIYVENKSTDSQLANILLNGEPMERFEPLYNHNQVFEPTNSSYELNLAPGNPTLPEVSAVLKMDKQTVDVTYPDSATIVLTVTAAAGAPNVTPYTLHFTTPLSTNTNLRVIEADNQPIDDFSAENTVYRFNLPDGAEVPNISWETEDERAHVDTTHTPEPTSETITLTVTAEDPSYTKTYTVIYNFVKSSIATLEMILADAQALPDFAPEKLDYSYEHDAAKPFPALDYEKGEENQKVRVDTVSFMPGESLKRSLQVTAQNGNTNTYFVEYHIVKSSVDTLLNISVDGKRLAEYRADVYEYFYRLEAEDAASRTDTISVICNPGDETQTVKVKNVPETMSGKSMGYKAVITVTAQTGALRVYTVHYPVKPSTVTMLKMIYLNGQELEGFDTLRNNYNQEIGMTDALPLVTVEKKEAAQTVDISINQDTVRVTVTAEDGETKDYYSITFSRLKSAETKLRNIILVRDNRVLPSSLFPYRPDYYEYTITLDFDGTRTALEQIPEVNECVKYDAEQSVNQDIQELPNGDVQINITVTAPNGEDQAIYSITFSFRKPSDATLISITLGDNLIVVDERNTEYEYAHPFGSTTEDYFTPEQVSYVLSDPLATATHTIDAEGKIMITVVAQDGSDLTYFVTQYIALDGDNWLESIELDGVEIRDFDPEVTFYTHYLRDGLNPPAIVAFPRSENAEVIYGIAAAGDTCDIICKAADQSERVYRIYFAKSEINDALTPTENDVILLRVSGENKLLIASIRQNVAFALYDQNGHLVHFEETVPAADPNDVVVFQDVHNKDVFSKLIGDKTCRYIDVLPNQIYFYGFYTSDKKFKSGKIICIQQ